MFDTCQQYQCQKINLKLIHYIYVAESVIADRIVRELVCPFLMHFMYQLDCRTILATIRVLTLTFILDTSTFVICQ